MDLKRLSETAIDEVRKASSAEELFRIEKKYLGKKGELTKILRSLSDLPAEKRKETGKNANILKNTLEGEIKAKNEELSGKTKGVVIDVTAPGKRIEYGHLHPITQILNELIEAGKMLGFSVVDGPEIETAWYNFDALNTDENHPSRDHTDTFYISNDLLLRTHTSPVQIRYMQENKPPIRIFAPGRVYRRDSDATHTPMFNQLEGLLVDEEVTMSDLKGTLLYLVQAVFGEEREIRLRPHHFPFTEPSAEVDVSCGLCSGKGCKSCKGEGWLEILGAGMVHPNVLRAGGIDPKKYQGFAFGMGIERIAMLKYGVDDLRAFYDNDLRFTEQF
ncbi:MAG: phenylalanine--tRNA ligase subunit alpha [Patescibacteria group bacterium]|nr:phenylalanine--tRNA ligase subunit alpha [Patescibacteria group bacterium]